MRINYKEYSANVNYEVITDIFYGEIHLQDDLISFQVYNIKDSEQAMIAAINLYLENCPN